MKIRKDKKTHRWVSPLIDNVSAIRIVTTATVEVVGALNAAVDRRFRR